MHLREDAKDLEITMPSYTTGFILKAELHRIMSWDTWKLPQKRSQKNERPISLFFLEIWSLVFTPLPRKPWENGNGCFISTKIYHSPKERKKYGLKEKKQIAINTKHTLFVMFSWNFKSLDFTVLFHKYYIHI